MAIACVVGRMVFVAGVLVLPMCIDCRRHLDQPGAVFGSFQKVSRGKILGSIRRGIAERLEQPGMNERRNVVRLAVQHPARLLPRQAEGQLAEQRQEPMLFFFHALTVVIFRQMRTRLVIFRHWRENTLQF